MAIRSSGPISFSDLQTEAGITGQISLGDGQVRDIIGAISNVSMSNAYSKTRDFTFNIPALSTRSFITTLAYDAGWQGTGNLVAVIPQGTVTATLVTGQNSWGTLTLYNSGLIMGKGGNGGLGGGGVVNSGTFSMTVNPGGSGGFGSDGLVCSTASTNRVQRQLNVINYGTIAGGGGGGGGGNPQAAGTGAGDVDGVGGGGGGGGRGTTGGTAGGGGTVSVINGGGSSVDGGAGNSGDQNSAGVGGPAASPPRFGQWYGGAGGSGGGLGAGGGSGGANAAGWPYQGAGGGAGSAILFNTNINGFFGNYGTVLGAVA